MYYEGLKQAKAQRHPLFACLMQYCKNSKLVRHFPPLPLPLSMPGLGTKPPAKRSPKAPLPRPLAWAGERRTCITFTPPDLLVQPDDVATLPREIGLSNLVN